MAERNSWAVSGPATGLITTEDARLAVTALMQAGVTPVAGADGIRAGVGDPGRVAAATPSPNTTVTVQPFQMFSSPRAGGHGSYVQTLDGVKVIDILGAHPASTSVARDDLIVAVQTDTFYGDPANSFVVKQLVGGVDPVPAGAVKLASVHIAANAQTVNPENITDLRPPNVVGLGGVVPVRDATQRAALSAYRGLTAYRGDRNWLEVNDGAAWRVPSVPVCTALTDITNPYQGQLVASLTDGLLYTYTGTAWVGAVATGATPHEARYELRAGQTQTYPQGVDTRVVFPTVVYSTPDVTTTDNAVFTLNRGGLWSITLSLRLSPGGGANSYEAYLAITDGGDNITKRYAHQNGFFGPATPPTMSTSTQVRLPAGATISGSAFTQAPTTRTTDSSFGGPNHITFTWLRP
ncbi:hypothetical protein [Kutzneria sp. CA-103260]|uniref:hypothetical protein n=1 Tax=Kutzneria sp. CA-103260 TaxID=2802641 RepID=UPI001BAC8AA0|nr:hypothetical protein [Kutzneria sp. CA-103260]QUQ69172.1 hypothetical protein JJ691_69260 [Kutzneria sp. CA-103260]